MKGGKRGLGSRGRARFELREKLRVGPKLGDFILDFGGSGEGQVGSQVRGGEVPGWGQTCIIWVPNLGGRTAVSARLRSMSCVN